MNNAHLSPHHSLKHGGVCGACRMRRVGHPLSQVTGAVQRVCVGPLFKRLLPIEEHQLERHWDFLKRKKWDEINSNLFHKQQHLRDVSLSAVMYF